MIPNIILKYLFISFYEFSDTISYFSLCSVDICLLMKEQLLRGKGLGFERIIPPTHRDFSQWRWMIRVKHLRVGQALSSRHQRRWILPSACRLYEIGYTYPPLTHQSPYSNRLPSFVHPSRAFTVILWRVGFKSEMSQTFNSPLTPITDCIK